MILYNFRSSNVGSKNLNKENSNADDEGLISEPTTGHSELNVKAVKSFVDTNELAKASQAYKESIEKFESETNPTVILKAIKLIDEQKEAVNVRLNAILDESKATEPAVKEIDEKVKQLLLGMVLNKMSILFNNFWSQSF